MCLNEECPLKLDCRRSPYSGTEPNPHWQPWARLIPTVYPDGTVTCEYKMPTLSPPPPTGQQQAKSDTNP